MGSISYVGAPPFRIEPPQKSEAIPTKSGVLMVLELPTAPVGPDEIPPSPILVETMIDPLVALDLARKMKIAAEIAQRWMDEQR